MIEEDDVQNRTIEFDRESQVSIIWKHFFFIPHAVIVLNLADLTCKKCPVLKADFFLTNYFYGNLDKCIRKFLRYCCQLLDK